MKQSDDKTAGLKSGPAAASALGRRGFLKLGLGAAVGSTALPILGQAASHDPAHGASVPAVDPLTGALVGGHPNYSTAAGKREVREGIPNRRWVMVIDLAQCDGCEKCTVACSKHHATPPDRQWIRVFKMETVPGKNLFWFPKPCFHCDDPPCTRVCPVDATFKRQDGIVLIDNERCIGCRFCMAACPYSTRHFNWGRSEQAVPGSPYSPELSTPRRVGTVEKCDFCPDLLREGKLPHCATACTMGAILFGDQNEDAVTDGKGKTYRLSKLLQDNGGYRYLEELGTSPRVYYLPAKNPTYDPPKREPT